jgi:hypothetical protein
MVNGQIDLGEYVSEEFVYDETQVVNFNIPTMPNIENRKSELNQKSSEMPRMTFVARRSKAEVKTPMNIHAMFRKHNTLLAPVLKEYVALEDSLTQFIVAAEQLRAIQSNSRLADALISHVVMKLATPYMVTGAMSSQEIIGMSDDPTVEEMKEFTLHSGLSAFEFIAIKMGWLKGSIATDPDDDDASIVLTESAVITRLKKQLASMSDSEFYDILQQVVPRAAKILN